VFCRLNERLALCPCNRESAVECITRARGIHYVRRHRRYFVGPIIGYDERAVSAECHDHCVGTIVENPSCGRFIVNVCLGVVPRQQSDLAFVRCEDGNPRQ
jgi:hypothetical protein